MPDSIQDFCEQEWDANKADCSAFVRAVAGDLGITLSGQANALIDTMGRPPWTQLGTDTAKAATYAQMGYLVIAGLKATPNGHVAVIMPVAPSPYLTGYWGMLHGVGRKNTTLNWSWNHTDLPNVQYFAIKP